MSLNFPNTPTVGQTYTADGQTFVWNGAVWIMQGVSLPWATDAEMAAGAAPDKIASPITAGNLVKDLYRTNDPFAGIPTQMISQRALSVDYQNPFDRSMFILVEGTGMGNNELLVGPAAPGTLRIGACSITTAGQSTTTSGFIPAGWFYRMITSSGDLRNWHEWR